MKLDTRNTVARNLRRNESKAIITIVPDICDPYFAEIIRGIEDAAVENRYLVLLGDSGQQKKRESSFVNLVFTKQADGMLLLVPITIHLMSVSLNKESTSDGNGVWCTRAGANGTYRQPNLCIWGNELPSSIGSQAHCSNLGQPLQPYVSSASKVTNRHCAALEYQ
ncbi:hypothetical protein O9929_06010 [Vibrio lentus]|nr:hypothetical protein [Vibrio lentus]